MSLKSTQTNGNMLSVLGFIDDSLFTRETFNLLCLRPAIVLPIHFNMKRQQVVSLITLPIPTFPTLFLVLLSSSLWARKYLRFLWQSGSFWSPLRPDHQTAKVICCAVSRVVFWPLQEMGLGFPNIHNIHI